MIAQIDKHYVKTRPGRLLPRLISYLLFEGRPLTTKGRWINPLVFGIHGAAKRLPQLKPVEKPIYIIGTGRSGTTILGVLLSMHREVGFLNEPKALWHSAYPNEDLIGNYSSLPAHYRMSEAQTNDELRITLQRLYGAYLRMTGSRRVVDKYPEMIFRTPFIKSLFPSARFLFLARNGWDTCTSIDRWSQRLAVHKGDETHDWWGRDDRKWRLLVEQLLPEHRDLASHQDEIMAFDKHTDRAAVEWIISMREGMQLCENDPDHVMRIDYEKLTADPDTWLSDILSFCELPDDVKFLEYGKDTLRPVPPRKPFELADVLRGPFEETQRKLGYE